MRLPRIVIYFTGLLWLTISSIACGRDSDFDPDATDDEIVVEEPQEEEPGEGNGEEEENTDDIPPTAPTNLNADDISPSTTDLSWDAATDNIGVTSYQIYQDEVEIDRVADTNYNVTGLSPNTSYSFAVTALDAATNESEFSEAVVITTAETSDHEAPSAPSNLRATAIAQTTLDLSWDAATDNVGVTSYAVYQDDVEIARVAVTTYQVTGLNPDTSYDFRLTAFDIAGNESESTEVLTLSTLEATDTEAPSVPANLMASSITETSLDLNWDASTDNVAVTSYRIFQDNVEIATITPTNYQVTGLVANTSYDFVIVALDMAGNTSESSDVLTVSTLQAPDTEAPSIPSNLAASNIGETSFDLSWDAATDNVAVTSYTVFQDNVAIAVVNTTNYGVTGLAPNTSYAFSVNATDAAGNTSANSAVLNVTTLTPQDTEPPSAPTNLIASNTTQTTTDLSWNAAMDNVAVTAYNIYQDAVQIAMVNSTNFQITGLTANTSYTFGVTALDAEGNESASSNTVNVMTEEEPQNTTDQVLVFTKTAGFRHSSIGVGVSTLESLGASNNFEITQTEDASEFSFANLQQYQLVVFLNTTGDVLNNTQQAAFEQYIQNGGSFMGIHSATDTEFDWPWYGELVGAYFDNHPAIQEAAMDIVDATHPATSSLPSRWIRTDEWYNFRDMNPAINSLINLDESSYSGGEDGAIHPIAWFHEFDGGRSFYTAMGHTEASYAEPDFRNHLLGGILYCLNR
ncbi:ThuA domain-containing protein [Spongiimicrobium salis]|uniref:ThuA domain-containing protein n=1 Tax=Spongiimicrobium salis TaxID=1667022 RepID=UPI00374DCA7E